MFYNAKKNCKLLCTLLFLEFCKSPILRTILCKASVVFLWMIFKALGRQLEVTWMASLLSGRMPSTGYLLRVSDVCASGTELVTSFVSQV